MKAEREVSEMSFASDMIRTQFKAGDDIRDAGLTTPADIVRYDDIVYGEDPRWQSLDVYRPREAAGRKLPIIVSVHGGGWVYGDKERYQYYCMSLAQFGFAVVNFTYRLAPEFKYPAALEDTNHVFSWVLAHAEEYGFDTEHVFGVGDSAGGHYLGLYAALCTNPDFAKSYPFQPPKGFAPTAIALNCGAFRVTMGNEELDRQIMQVMKEDLLPGGATEEELEEISVMNHVTPDFPPAFIMTCTGDFTKPLAPVLADKLAEQEVPFVYRFYGDQHTVLGHVFHCDVRSEAAHSCNEDEIRFFRSFC